MDRRFVWLYAGSLLQFVGTYVDAFPLAREQRRPAGFIKPCRPSQSARLEDFLQGSRLVLAVLSRV
jgi:hypothetical protein